MRAAIYAAIVCLCAAPSIFAQDAVKVDPKHYSVISENDQVRILKAHYGPHEKSVMHSHPNSVAVYLTDGKIVMHLPNGTSQEATSKAGGAALVPATTHLPENASDTAEDVIVIELKTPVAKPAMK